MKKLVFQLNDEIYNYTIHDDANDPNVDLVNLTKSFIFKGKKYIAFKEQYHIDFYQKYIPEGAILISSKTLKYKSKNLFENAINYRDFYKALEDPEFIAVIEKIKSSM